MRSTFNILFYVNKSKEKNGVVPVMGRVTINGTQSLCYLPLSTVGNLLAQNLQ